MMSTATIAISEKNKNDCWQMVHILQKKVVVLWIKSLWFDDKSIVTSNIPDKFNTKLKYFL